MELRKGKIIEYYDLEGRIAYGAITSNNKCLQFSPTFQVCPLKKNKKGKYIPNPKSEVILSREQIITVVGKLKAELIKEIDDAIISHHTADANDEFEKGEIWYCKIPKESGSIQYGCRPVCIASAEVVKGKVHIIPFTTKLKKLGQPTHVVMHKAEGNLDKNSMLLAEAEMSVDVSCFTNKIGELTPNTWIRVLDAVKIQHGIMVEEEEKCS